MPSDNWRVQAEPLQYVLAWLFGKGGLSSPLLSSPLLFAVQASLFACS
jgi:hypothetical protein